MKLEDILAPYQYDPQSPPRLLDSFETELNWFGTKRPAVISRIAFAPNQSDFYIFWRFEGDDGAWGLSERRDANCIEKLWDKKEVTPEKILHRLRTAIGAGAFCRLLYIADLQRFVSLTSHSGAFYDWLDRPSRSFYLKWSSIKHQQCSTTIEAFEDVLLDEQSDAVFATKLLGKRSHFMNATVFGFEDISQYEESLKSFELLVIYAAWSMEELWHQSDNEYVVLINLDNRESTRLVGIPSSSPSSQKLFTITEKDERWIRIIKAFGPLQMNAKYIKKHHALEHYRGPIKVPIPHPTAHERLEAKFQLLEWAKNHLPPEKYIEVEAMET